ncbi:MAG: phosphonate ABC transporter, permease protein PhnE [Thioclava marina]|uniref:Phosphonate ABC transporter, permease protein PhnE n=1 Tax=Thioclava marina TaxID=1915077 RepID=A0ABX3MHV7_9RHOB|nr:MULTISPECIES: phosphonate ABC transporter, permease protein PhnE [Thioclava]TNE93631.1 MAG: phosphonate ABC transporter, permease protein PhnE [Paracoccaceae bacterium]MBC7144637.1 phosphonate ABC transporter, permease protein PhnE [Thioclava marina]MBD3802571.1 phosphonate ABC transporter, permease protein PhnE [Thioclava sp.]OOY10937.1 phosphonate ABC transporter, permease protein PhnE [Thioclava marina]OOY27287.1 phosphonate ABC transporter, permease protein PhnE [Thioclava sp. L04-15]
MTDIAPPSATAEDYLAQTRRKRLYGAILLAIFVAMMASGFRLADARNAGGFFEGLHRFFDFPAEIFSEAIAKWQNIPGLLWRYLPSLIETLNIAAVSTLIGGIAAIVLALLSTRGLSLWPRAIPVFRRAMDVMRALPEIVVALVLIFLLGVGPVPAMAAIALHTMGALGKLFSEVAENADLKPVEGLGSTGASWFQQMWVGVLPQVAPNWSSYALLRFEINIRASAILGFVGAGGIGYDLKTALQWGQGRYDAVVAIFALLFATIILVDHFSDRARARLVRGATAKEGRI